MCGLKLGNMIISGINVSVTPFVGVWIETRCRTVRQLLSRVTPFVGVWIETMMQRQQPYHEQVTPFVGVWIETVCLRVYLPAAMVTPFVGVWIETRTSIFIGGDDKSHPSWVCGLKHDTHQAMIYR